MNSDLASGPDRNRRGHATWWLALAAFVVAMVAVWLQNPWRLAIWMVPAISLCLVDGFVTLYRTRWTFRFLLQMARVAVVLLLGWYVQRHDLGIDYVVGVASFIGVALLLNRLGDALARRHWPRYEALFRAAGTGVVGPDLVLMRHIPTARNSSWWGDLDRASI